MAEAKKNKSIKHGAMKHKCDCLNEFQDKEYGPGIRLMSYCKLGQRLRCTSCLKEHDIK